MWPLVAVRTAWLAVFFTGLGVFLLWLVFRVIGDFATWVREELFDEYRQLRKTSREARREKNDDEGKAETDDQG